MPTSDAAFKTVLKRQYHAGVAMLKETIERCPDEVWLASDHLNAFWQIAYHTLYFTHMYLQRDEAAFRPWERDQGGTQNPDGIAGPPDPKSSLPLIPQPYMRAQVLEYCNFCDRMIDGAVDDLDLQSLDCGFHWYRMSKLEHQLVSLRHLQHHTGQLADRLRAAANIGIPWVGGDELAA
jgi:DinB superfamily